ncbi:MBL fold metallo-hydrolase [Bathymodiolus septemdierum thioautotrophic gill symbiont]|uniref:Beta-lactamase n=1 Tax=endosymbiont of Bathymodiolus septemdierum str. Myojin knoll TaxID=1303921 RepID=A0A0P0UTD8_9GAMM|nr:MBL fold metallo-hydrolase [Bathymodiolus septemdierum thioautotrophic gill symbiont]BAS68368.1 beta-lactamase [endosymbiont of Bathymodiolus septemdierum str. Myojin knoll]
MKKLILTLTLIFLAIAVVWLLNSTEGYKFEKIADNVYVIHGPLDEPNAENRGFMNNPGLIVGANGAIIIDPGSAYSVGKNVLAAAEKITDKPIVAVFDTHVHGDHWLGNQAIVEHYPNVKIYAHPNMIEQAKDGEGNRWIALMNTLTEGATKGTIATYPTNATTHLQIINAGGETFKIHHNVTKAAHTNTDIMVEHIKTKTLFMGDNGLLHRHGRFDNTSDMHGNIKVLEYAIDLNLDYYVPGHGETGNAESTVKPLLTYLRIIRDEVKKGYEEDLADYEIKPLADKKLTDYRDWHGYESNMGKHIGKMFSEIEALDE